MPAALAAAGVGVATVRSASGLPRQLGATPEEIGDAVEKSAAYRNGRFHNLEPASTPDAGDPGGMVREFVAGRPLRKPAAPVPVEVPRFPEQADDLAVTWFGHATSLIEVDGYRVLVDPVWGRRVSPSPTIGPARMHPVPLVLSALPRLDVIIISHDHYDHLDMETVIELARSQEATFVVPLGVGAHLHKWGIDGERIVELDWGESHRIGDLTLGCCRARHFSGRGLKRDLTLWSSWAIVGPRHKVYFSGDSGYSTCFSEIGTQYGPFDLALIAVGAYDRRWPDIHLDPEEAVLAFVDVQSGRSKIGSMLPIHWGTFNLALHSWSDPIDRSVVAARKAGIDLWTPPPGRRLVAADTDRGPATEVWWRSDSAE